MSELGLDFELGEMADAIRDTTQRFASDRIAPLAAKIDEEDWFPTELWPEMGALGLHGITVSEEDGGLGLGYLEHVVAQEEVARAWVTPSTSSPWRKSRARRPPWACPTVRTPTCASTRSGATAARRRSASTCRS